jgi:hypothetical protein
VSPLRFSINLEMCQTCYNFKRDLTATGSEFQHYYGLHFYRRNVADVSYTTGPLTSNGDIDLMIDCLRRNRYACERIEIYMVGNTCIVDLHKLRDTRKKIG